MEINVKINNSLNTSTREKILEDHKYTRLFKSRLHEIAFYFEINDSKFDLELEILPIHKVDKNRAVLLKREFLKIFHPDKNKNSEDLDFNKICVDIESTFKRIKTKVPK